MPSVSDDPDDQENGMMFVGGSPQEIIKHQQEMHDKAHASAQELRASVDRMIDEMPAEHSYTLLRLFEHIAHGDASTIHFFVGQLTAVLRVVHKVCLTCGSTQHTTWLHGMEAPVGDLPDPREAELIANFRRSQEPPHADGDSHDENGKRRDSHDDHLFQRYPLECEKCAMECAMESADESFEEGWNERRGETDA